MKIIFVISTVFLHSLVSCGFSFGSCPQPKSLEPNFNITKYLGVWYEHARDTSVPFESGICQQARYYKENDKYMLTNSQLNDQTGEIETASGIISGCTGAQCKVMFNTRAVGDYRVVATDYQNFAVVYSC